ncbi:MAG: hypothetical protein JWM93_481, partial [Frankiales bacterium]|nr:hypothetical protein [Frankiales bacterium]
SLWDASPDGSSVVARNTSGLPDINDSTTFTLARNARLLALVTQQKKRAVLELDDAGWVAVPPRADGAKITAVMYAG